MVIYICVNMVVLKLVFPQYYWEQCKNLFLHLPEQIQLTDYKTFEE